MMTRERWVPIVLGLLLAPVAAQAQDADGDGVLDAADAFPCDPARASVSYFPGASSSAMLAYEDQWPASTDLDFNDVVLRVHYRLERDAFGDVVSLHALIDPDALGGTHSNGLGLQLPAPRAGATARRRVGSGAWEPLALEADASAAMVLSSNLRELFGNAPGRVNSVPGEPQVAGQRLELEVTFSPPAPLPVSAAPFDLFIFRAGDFSHQIHLPQYAGTAAMNTSLFNTEEDGSTPTRRFVHLTGIPAALSLHTSLSYPLEGVDISRLFPDIVTFAASGGALATSFYSSNVVSELGRPVLTRSITAQPADESCIGTCGPGRPCGAGFGCNPAGVCEPLATPFDAQVAWSSSSGAAVEPTPSVLSFGTLTVDTTANKTLFLRNVGASGAASVGLALSGDTAHFRIVSVQRVSSAGSATSCRSGGGLVSPFLGTTAPCEADDVAGGSHPHLRVVVRYAPTVVGTHAVALNLSTGNGTVLPQPITLVGAANFNPTVVWSQVPGGTTYPSSGHLSFGTRTVNGATQDRVVYLRNVGTQGALSVGVELSGDTAHFRLVSVRRSTGSGTTTTCRSGGSVPSPFLATSAPCLADDIASGSYPHIAVTLRYQPTDIGEHAIDLNLTGENGTEVPAAISFTGYGEFNSTVAWSQTPGSTTHPSSAHLSFGTRTVNGATQDRVVYLRNVGTHGPASVGVTLTGDTAHFRLVSVRRSTGSGTDTTCNSGGSVPSPFFATSAPCLADDIFGYSYPHVQVTVRYSPTAIGAHAVNLELSTGNGTVLPAPITFNGYGEFNSTVAWSQTPGSTTQPSSAHLSFGTRTVNGATQDRVVYLRNVGTHGPASVGVTLTGDTAHFRLVSVRRSTGSGTDTTCNSGGSIPSPFLATSAPCLADDIFGYSYPHVQVTVRYSPTAIGAHAVTLELSTGNGTVLPAPITFTGYGEFNSTVAWSQTPGSTTQPSSAHLSFGTRTVGTTLDRVVYLRNEGTHGPASVGVTLTGDTAHFRLVSVRRSTGSGTNTTCNSGGSIPSPFLATSAPCLADDIFGYSYPHVAVTVRYAPTASGTHAVTLGLGTGNGTELPGELSFSGSAP